MGSVRRAFLSQSHELRTRSSLRHCSILPSAAHLLATPTLSETSTLRSTCHNSRSTLRSPCDHFTTQHQVALFVTALSSHHCHACFLCKWTVAEESPHTPVIACQGKQVKPASLPASNCRAQHRFETRLSPLFREHRHAYIRRTT